MRLTKFDYFWHGFWLSIFIGSIIVTPVLMIYGYFNASAPMATFVYCWMVISVSLLILIDSNVSWVRRMERARKFLKK